MLDAKKEFYERVCNATVTKMLKVLVSVSGNILTWDTAADPVEPSPFLLKDWVYDC